MVRVAVLALLVFCSWTPALSAYTPAACAQLFDDVPNGNAFCPWIEELWREEISLGCGSGPLRYCPNDPLTRAEAAELLGKALHQHLWGQGRPNARVYGYVVLNFELLCDSAVGGVHFGLSRATVPWGEAAAACPAGYWVCTAEERGNSVCDTARPDTSCDAYLCNHSCWNLNPDDHYGWLADDSANIGQGLAQGEAAAGGEAFAADNCLEFSVWCCSR